MATQTTNLKLSKPAGTEKPDISVINDNMDKIDTAYGNMQEDLDNSIELGADITDQEG